MQGFAELISFRASGGAAPWPDAISDRRSSSTPLLKREKAPVGTYGSSQTFRRILHS